MVICVVCGQYHDEEGEVCFAHSKCSEQFQDIIDEIKKLDREREQTTIDLTKAHNAVAGNNKDRSMFAESPMQDR